MLLRDSSTLTLQILCGLVLCYLSPVNAITGEENLRKMMPRTPLLMIRPVQKVDETVPVVLGVTPVHVNGVDEVNGVLTITVWISQKWKTSFTWEETQFDGVTKLVMSGEGSSYKFWHPDISLIYSVGDNNYIPSKLDKQFIIQKDGEILWWTMTTLKTPCNFKSFKNSTVRCNLVFGSWQHTRKEINIQLPHHSESMDPLEYYQPTGLWQIANVTYSTGEAYYHCCPDPYPQVIVQLEMTKNETFNSASDVSPVTSAAFLNTPLSLFYFSVSLIILGVKSC